LDQRSLSKGYQPHLESLRNNPIYDSKNNKIFDINDFLEGGIGGKFLTNCEQNQAIKVCENCQDSDNILKMKKEISAISKMGGGSVDS